MSSPPCGSPIRHHCPALAGGCRQFYNKLLGDDLDEGTALEELEYVEAHPEQLGDVAVDNRGLMNSRLQLGVFVNGKRMDDELEWDEEDYRVQPMKTVRQLQRKAEREKRRKRRAARRAASAGDPGADAVSSDSDSDDAASDDSDDLEKHNPRLHATMHLRTTRHRPQTLQTNRPLAQAHPTLNTDVFYEVEIDVLDPNSRVALGWATSPFPPFKMCGDAPHSIAVHSCADKRIVNTVGPHSLPSVGSQGWLVLKSSEDTHGGRSMDMPALKEGDVVGVGFRQELASDATRDNEKLLIRFIFMVNGKMIDIEPMDLKWPAQNNVWAKNTGQEYILEKTLERAAKNPEFARLGILANGCAFPTISATGPCVLNVRFTPPFDYFGATQRLCTFQNKGIVRRRSLALAEKVRGRIQAEQKQDDIVKHEESRKRAQLAALEKKAGIKHSKLTGAAEFLESAVLGGPGSGARDLDEALAEAEAALAQMQGRDSGGAGAGKGAGKAKPQRRRSVADATNRPFDALPGQTNGHISISVTSSARHFASDAGGTIAAGGGAARSTRRSLTSNDLHRTGALQQRRSFSGAGSGGLAHGMVDAVAANYAAKSGNSYAADVVARRTAMHDKKTSYRQGGW